MKLAELAVGMKLRGPSGVVYVVRQVGPISAKLRSGCRTENYSQPGMSFTGTIWADQKALDLFEEVVCASCY